jgi:short-subunit dehydrogenase
MPAPLRTAYCAAKHALHGFFDTLRAELWREGIQVTLVCPAAVRTKISENALTGDGSRFGKMDRLIGTGMSPDECARQILEAVRRKKFEVVIGKPRYKVAVWLKRLAPSLYYRVLANTKVD